MGNDCAQLYDALLTYGPAVLVVLFLGAWLGGAYGRAVVGWLSDHVAYTGRWGWWR